MVFQHLIVIQFIYRVTGCDDNIRFMTAFQEIQVLINGVRRTPVPVPILRCNRRSKQIHAALLPSEIPPFGGVQMFIQ